VRRASCSSVGSSSLCGRIRITTFSPHRAGSVETRVSTTLPARLSRARPSCGRRRSEMSSPERILSRLIREAAADLGAVITSRSTPSTRNRTRTPSRSVSTCTSLAPWLTASPSSRSTSLTAGASSTASFVSSGATSTALLAKSSSSPWTAALSSDTLHTRVRTRRSSGSSATEMWTSRRRRCIRISSIARMSVGSITATFGGLMPSLAVTRMPYRSDMARGIERAAAGSTRVLLKSSSGSRNDAARAAAMPLSSANPSSTTIRPRRRRGPLPER